MLMVSPVTISGGLVLLNMEKNLVDVDNMPIEMSVRKPPKSDSLRSYDVCPLRTRGLTSVASIQPGCQSHRHKEASRWISITFMLAWMCMLAP